MAVKGYTIDFPIVAGATVSQYRIINVAGTVAADNGDGIGSVQNKPVSGDHAQVAVLGKMKGVAGAAVAAKAALKVQSGGWLITATSGSGAVGKNTNVAVASGETFEFYGNFINAVDVLGT